MGSGGGSGIEWMLSIGGIGVDAPEASGGGFRVSSAIVMVAIEGGLLECFVVVNMRAIGKLLARSGWVCLTRVARLATCLSMVHRPRCMMLLYSPAGDYKWFYLDHALDQYGVAGTESCISESDAWASSPTSPIYQL